MWFLSNNAAKPKLIIEAQVIKACSNCGSPGIINNKYVGENCPNCGTQRPDIEDKGIIFNNDPWFNLKRKINKWLGRKI